MTTGDHPRRRENAFTLVRRLASGGFELAKLEVQRGRQEIAREPPSATGPVSSSSRSRSAFVVLGVIVLMILLVLVISALTGVPGWVVALFIVLLLAALAALFAWRGIRRIQAAKFTPDETIAAVKEDFEWAKRLLRRG